MLESACIRRPRMTNGQYDVGQILETMLFYDQVHLYIDMPLFNSLWTTLGYSGLKDILSHPRLSASITPEFCAVRNQSYGSMVGYLPVFGRMAGRAEKRVSDNDYAGILSQSLGALHDGKTKRQIQSLINLSKRTEYDNILGGLDNYGKMFLSAASDPDGLKIFLRHWIRRNGGFPDDHAISSMQIDHMISDGEIILSSNIPISKTLINPGNIRNSDMHWGAILPQLNDYIIELHISNINSSDIIYADDIEKICRSRIDLSINRSLSSQNNIKAFSDYSFDGPAISDAFNQGYISLTDTLKLIDRTEKFRKWTKSLPPNSDIIEEYNKSISSDHIIDKMPVKVLRFAAFAGIGMGIDLMTGGGGLGTAAGTSISVFDSFLLDRIAKGWRPNSFVQSVKAAKK